MIILSNTNEFAAKKKRSIPAVYIMCMPKYFMLLACIPAGGLTLTTTELLTATVFM